MFQAESTWSEATLWVDGKIFSINHFTMPPDMWAASTTTPDHLLYVLKGTLTIEKKCSRRRPSRLASVYEEPMQPASAISASSGWSVSCSMVMPSGLACRTAQADSSSPMVAANARYLPGGR